MPFRTCFFFLHNAPISVITLLYPHSHSVDGVHKNRVLNAFVDLRLIMIAASLHLYE